MFVSAREKPVTASNANSPAAPEKLRLESRMDASFVVITSELLSGRTSLE